MNQMSVVRRRSLAKLNEWLDVRQGGMSAENFGSGSFDKGIRVGQPAPRQIREGRRDLASFGERLQAVYTQLAVRVARGGQKCRLIEPVLTVQHPERMHSLALVSRGPRLLARPRCLLRHLDPRADSQP